VKTLSIETVSMYRSMLEHENSETTNPKVPIVFMANSAEFFLSS
jgi:hypothetical protein